MLNDQGYQNRELFEFSIFEDYSQSFIKETDTEEQLSGDFYYQNVVNCPSCNSGMDALGSALICRSCEMENHVSSITQTNFKSHICYTEVPFGI